MIPNRKSSLRRSITLGLLLFFSLQLLVGLFYLLMSFYSGQESVHSAFLTMQAKEYLLAKAQDSSVVTPRNPSFSVYLSTDEMPSTLSTIAEDLSVGYHDLDEVDPFGSGEQTELQVYIVDIQNIGRHYFVSRIFEPDDVNFMRDKTLGFIGSYTLAAMVLSFFFIWLLRRHYLHPLNALIDSVNTWDFSSEPSQFAKTYNKGDLGILARSLDELSQRQAEFLRREQNTTRNISHELRTPITVIRSTLDLMQMRANKNGEHENDNQLAKLKRACDELEANVYGILYLGREKHLDNEITEATEECRDIIQGLEEHPAWNMSYVELDIENGIVLNCQRIMFRILVGNLLRNALEHGEVNSIKISLNSTLLSIHNTQQSPLEDIDENHFGLGLDIVRQICERLTWRFSLTKSGVSICAKVTF
ncbi:sensor histidine kinase [Agaribacter marinus]|uniref:histidine kinase n=1 Tax=Agaribacter marinus TaxID=1431249 RepID=A0AA37SX16_9ALTE|nr:HAMP domain-containing sensor histidine kinase [Agaribacter marinus]GLR71368.1 hypothetical protein GCM10007852_22760 [Agaribacter marinus]